jgi:hypothetical protein
MEAIKITFEDLKDLLPIRTSLYYVDYSSNLDEHTELIQKCIDNKNTDALYEAIDEWYSESPFYEFESLDKELTSDICSKFEIEEDEAKEVIAEHFDGIRDHYYNVDDSTVLKDLVRNSSSIAVRIPLYSNFDCINSHYFEGGYAYKESYFGAMVDVLNLNPAKVKKLLVENDVKVYGSFPNYKHREGKELVSYADFWQELENSSCGANLLVFIAKVNIQDLIDNNFELKEITIPKGNRCGLFSDFQGGGSVLEMELQRDFKVKLDVPRKKNLTKYDSFSLLIDETNGYSINEVYGVSSEFFGNEIVINHG